MKQPIRNTSWEVLQRLDEDPREVTMKPVRFCQMSRNGRQRPVLGWLSQLGCPGWMDTMDTWDHPFGMAGVVGREIMQLKWCFRPSDHNIFQYITIIPVINIYKRMINWDCGYRCDPEVWRDAKPPGVNWDAENDSLQLGIQSGSDWDPIGRTSGCQAEQLSPAEVACPCDFTSWIKAIPCQVFVETCWCR
jgi:hypothetical protein